MTFSFSKDFFKQLKKANSTPLNKSLKSLLDRLPEIENVADLSNTKKLKGHNDAYRIRLGKYRAGFYLEQNNHLFFAAIPKRETFYKSFPK